MAPRQNLQDLLKGVQGETTETKVYFQPPSKDKMVYPCIVYDLDDVDTSHADNEPYTITDQYQVTVIDRNPDTLIRKAVEKLPRCSFNRKFVVDGLHHFVYKLYY
jgi:hypothetical protein